MNYNNCYTSTEKKNVHPLISYLLKVNVNCTSRINLHIIAQTFSASSLNKSASTYFTSDSSLSPEAWNLSHSLNTLKAHSWDLSVFLQHGFFLDKCTSSSHVSMNLFVGGWQPCAITGFSESGLRRKEREGLFFLLDKISASLHWAIDWKGYQQRRHKEQLPNEAMMAHASDDCMHALTPEERYCRKI